VSPTDGSKELSLVITGVDKALLSETQLDVSAEDIRIQIGSGAGAQTLQLHLLFVCDVQSVKASMSKKKRAIEVLLHEKR
jgi:hypothetical protein